MFRVVRFYVDRAAQVEEFEREERRSHNRFVSIVKLNARDAVRDSALLAVVEFADEEAISARVYTSKTGRVPEITDREPDISVMVFNSHGGADIVKFYSNSFSRHYYGTRKRLADAVKHPGAEGYDFVSLVNGPRVVRGCCPHFAFLLPSGEFAGALEDMAASVS